MLFSLKKAESFKGQHKQQIFKKGSSRTIVRVVVSFDKSLQRVCKDHIGSYK